MENGFDADFPTEIITEGKIKILVPKLAAFVKSPSDYAPSKAPVFYNPVMRLNRDIAVLALQAYQKTVKRLISVCEPLAGCGVRAVRFATEVKGIKKVVVGDISGKAVKLARQNVQMNGLSKRITVKHQDANLLLAHYSVPRKRFDAVDVDPFGSPVLYLDSAVRALRNGGLLALTATDMAPLCGVHPRACVRKYGGKPLRTEYCHELAVRLLVGCLARTAAKHDIGINVLLSQSTDHYVRTYATIGYGAKKADESIKNLGYVLHCFKCFHREILTRIFPSEQLGKCVECGSRMEFAGPLWVGKLFDKQFCMRMEEQAQHMTFNQRERIRRLLALMINEADAPATYYVVDKICDRLGLPVPSVKSVIEALKKEGFQACLTHFNHTGIRTDASAASMCVLVRKVVGSSSSKF